MILLLLILYLLLAIQLIFSWKSLTSGLRFLRFVREDLATDVHGPFPTASLIVPFRGLDPGLFQNVAAMLEQRYPAYEAIFVFEGEDDPAESVVIEACDGTDVPVKRIYAGMAEGRGQKVHNLLAAVGAASPDSKYFVFADSDARPSPDWLRNLVAPAASEQNVCASGYRWFIPETGGIGTHLRSVWNASIASALGPDRDSNFCWGGSTAISRDLFERARVADAWQRVVSDDFALTQAVRKAGGTVRFVPACLTASVEDCSFREMLEFTTRQMKITRVYSPKHWKYSLVGSSVMVLSIVAAAALIAIGGVHAPVASAFLIALFALGTAKAAIRLKAVALALKDYAAELKKQAVWQLTLWTLTPFIFVYNDLVALASRRIAWRGVVYELESAETTTVVSRNRGRQ